MKSWPEPLLALASVILACLVSLAPATAGAAASGGRVERTEPLPKRLVGIDVVEQLDKKLPLDLGFTNENGQPVMLSEYFDGKVPVILTFNYSSCPMLCSLQLNGFVEGLKQLDMTPGKEFRIVTILLDPNETPESAKKFQRRYLAQLGRPEAEKGWHFLIGSERNIRAVADADGFQYGYNEKRKEYVHPAVVTILTPDARISRYLYGLVYHPKTLRLSLVESSEGKIGSTVDRLILYCFHYDETEGRYAPVAVKIMKLGGGLGALVLGGFLAAFWIGERKKKKRVQEDSLQHAN